MKCPLVNSGDMWAKSTSVVTVAAIGRVAALNPAS